MNCIRAFAWRGVPISLTLLIMLGASGCGGPKLYPVKGRVMFPDGKPLTGGRVSFELMESETNVSAGAQIQSDGTFRLGTFRTADGAIAGRYRALVTPPLPVPLDERRPPKPLIDKRFESYDTLGLVFVVKSEPNEFTITVERP
jgi:hypothetical protein